MDNLLQVAEVTIMKSSAMYLAVVLAGFAGAAFAGNPQQVMGSVNVSARAVAACTPPNGATGHACDAYDEFVRANFTPRQIGMLFGSRSSYPEYLTGGVDRLQHRYDTLIQQFVAAHATANDASVATR